MPIRLFAIYNYCSRQGWHGAVILFVAGSILLVGSGTFFSAILFLVTYFGCIAVLFDPSIRRALGDPTSLALPIVLLGSILIWQTIGTLVREPAMMSQSNDLISFSALGNTLGIVMLLPVFAAAFHYDPCFMKRLLMVLFGVGCLAATISLGFYAVRISESVGVSWETLSSERLVPIGRARHAILGAGGLACSFFAGLALWKAASPPVRGLIAAGVIVILTTIMLTQSRGPIIGLCLATGATFLTMHVQQPRMRVAVALTFAAMCAVAPATLVLIEASVQTALSCGANIGMCRNSLRQEVWATVVSMIPERPWFGIGPTFRFTQGTIHPHNGILGVSFFFGIPVAVLFITLIIIAVIRSVRAPILGQAYGLSGILFAIAFLSTDLPNPFSFINAHVLFLWFPILTALVLGSPYLLPKSTRPNGVHTRSEAVDIDVTVRARS